LQQVTGINTIIYYGPQIFALAGIGSDEMRSSPRFSSQSSMCSPPSSPWFLSTA
jgi:hypothetical protein